MRRLRMDQPLMLLGLGAGLLIISIIVVGIAWLVLDPLETRVERPASVRDESPGKIDRKPTDRSLVGRLAEIPSHPFLGSLPTAARVWRESRGPVRLIVDQVCLVPDIPTFLEAIELWDDHHYFPILVDDPTWTLPFLRAFRPARVVRLEARPVTWDREMLWKSAIQAVERSWGGSTDDRSTRLEIGRAHV